MLTGPRIGGDVDPVTDGIAQRAPDVIGQLSVQGRHGPPGKVVAAGNDIQGDSRRHEFSETLSLHKPEWEHFLGQEFGNARIQGQGSWVRWAKLALPLQCLADGKLNASLGWCGLAW